VDGPSRGLVSGEYRALQASATHWRRAMEGLLQALTAKSSCRPYIQSTRIQATTSSYCKYSLRQQRPGRLATHHYGALHFQRCP